MSTAHVNIDDLRVVLAAVSRSSALDRHEITAADRLRQALQPSLFDQPLSDPGVDAVGAYHAGAGLTERRAAYEMLPESGIIRRRVLDVIALAGEHGRTDQELEDELGLQRPTGGNRRGELMVGGWVRDSGLRRPTRSGKPAAVWVLTVEGRRKWDEARAQSRGRA